MKHRRTTPLFACLSALVCASLACSVFNVNLGSAPSAPAPAESAPAANENAAPADKSADNQNSPNENGAEAQPAEGGAVGNENAANENAAGGDSADDSAPPVEEICPAGESCIVAGSFWLARPVAVEFREETDPSYRFSMIRRGVGPHLGADFLNSTGTPVIAAADGTVVVAGDDRKKAYSNKVNEYGSLVILQHSLPGVNLPVFTLYAHLSEVLVQEGQAVKAGDRIGKVGSSGGVRGSTLHFEVRLGENSYKHVRNPELWLAPMPADDGQPTGAIAGRIVNERGKPVTVNNIVIEQLEGSGQGVLDTWYVRQYREPRNSGQEPWLETFALSSLPPGLYQISFFYQGMQQRVLEVKAGQLTLTTFQFESDN